MYDKNRKKILLEIDLPTKFLHKLRSFLDREMDRVQLINNPTHLFSLNINIIDFFSSMARKIFERLNKTKENL